MPEISFLYVTAPDETTASKLAEGLVEERLAACVNIIPGMRSVFRWQGLIECAKEFVLIVKTTKKAAPAACDLIRRLHPYETPAITAFGAAAEGSNPAFLAWIENETRKD